MIIVYENMGSKIFKDVWKARNDYIDVVRNDSSSAADNFFMQNAVKELSENEKLAGLKLLEMQKYSMLMFTSCGWFFSEISGLETVKILEYAARAIELLKELTGLDIETEFKNRLAEAISNIPKYKTGKGVYEKLVIPHKHLRIDQI